MITEDQTAIVEFLASPSTHGGVTVEEGCVTIAGQFADESERRIAIALSKTVPGTRMVSIAAGE